MYAITLDTIELIFGLNTVFSKADKSKNRPDTRKFGMLKLAKLIKLKISAPLFLLV